MYKGVKVELNLKEKKCVFIYQGLISTETNESGAVKDYDSLLEIVNDQSPAEGLTLVEKKLYRNKKNWMADWSSFIQSFHHSEQ